MPKNRHRPIPSGNNRIREGPSERRLKRPHPIVLRIAFDLGEGSSPTHRLQPLGAGFNDSPPSGDGCQGGDRAFGKSLASA